MRKSEFFRAVSNRSAAFGVAGAASNRAVNALAREHTSGSEPEAKSLNLMLNLLYLMAFSRCEVGEAKAVKLMLLLSICKWGKTFWVGLKEEKPYACVPAFLAGSDPAKHVKGAFEIGLVVVANGCKAVAPSYRCRRCKYWLIWLIGPYRFRSWQAKGLKTKSPVVSTGFEPVVLAGPAWCKATAPRGHAPPKIKSEKSNDWNNEKEKAKKRYELDK
ncbi:hypothetical protein GGTG_01105 [Gaeumannomyces tritici R3-111a-1]|uniref:Uncharacterized protein n=1 Tax=Gaeumannomyces tritici (strain R3-111a-1) TaxID=644352 RepID=J3NIM7_GAET3|nr:hypothetical protein GGTG_01105 [Gaeumannomyces tritici R3-111a-1]EJT81120.1 hypothetical protein GGTG_01105 [Gaeumannomyces tritici R3-111a-1]